MTRFSQYRSQRGAIFVEVALFLPLFVSVFFGFVFFSTATNAYMSLEYSVGFVRYAFTRGDAYRVGKDDVIDAVRQWRSGDSTDLEKMLNHGVSSSSLSYYDDMARDVFGYGCGISLSLSDLPDSYVYALVYVAQVMRQSIGDTDVRYPCDPNGSGPDDGAGCLKCSLMHATTASSAYGPSDPTPSFCDIDYNANWVGVSCDYRFGMGVMGPLVSTIGYMTNSSPDSKMIVHAQRFFESTS
ncbi:MAG: hypothetical protein KDD66_13625 [Bdellovibrionales bacterium]|nr:hypothetical protein [Bdellovibrionales bacterium]